MSWLSTILKTCIQCARFFHAFMNQWFTLAKVISSKRTETICRTGGQNDSPLLDGRSRPEFMSRGFTPKQHETPTEAFPAYNALEPSEEEAAMHAAHTYTDLLPIQVPDFSPTLTALDPRQALETSTNGHADIFIHKDEAHDALYTAMQFACVEPKALYSPTEPAFASPRTLRPHTSPLLSTMWMYIEDTYEGAPHRIRVAPPSQLRLELETCLLLAFTTYVTSDAFCNAEGENTIVPAALADVLVAGASRGPGCLPDIREAVEWCEYLDLVGGEEFLDIWEAWKYVAECYVGLLVLRHEGRKVEEITWV